MKIKTDSNKIMVSRDELNIFTERDLNYIDLLDLFLASPEKVIYVEEKKSKKLKGIITVDSLSNNYNAPDQWINTNNTFVIQSEDTKVLPIPVLDEEGVLKYELRNQDISVEIVENHKNKQIQEIDQMIELVDFRKWNNIAVYGYEKEIANVLLEKLVKKGYNVQIMEREEIILDERVDLFLCLKDSEAQLFRGILQSKNTSFNIPTVIKSIRESVCELM